MRTRSVIATLCAAAIAFAAPASAYQSQSSSAAKEKQAGQKKVCRWIERTGSHRSERICLTAEEWRKVDEFVSKEF